MAATHILPETIGHQAAARMILTGDLFPADEAHAMGVVSEVVDEPDSGTFGFFSWSRLPFACTCLSYPRIAQRIRSRDLPLLFTYPPTPFPAQNIVPALDRGLAIARSIAASSPIAVRLATETLRNRIDTGLHAALMREADAQVWRFGCFCFMCLRDVASAAAVLFSPCSFA